MPTERRVYFNGKFVPESDARMSIFDTGVKVGAIVYEVTRTFDGRPFRMDDHMERLYTGLKLLGIDCGMTMHEMEAATHETIEANRACFPDGRDFEINHDVSSGPPGGPATVIIHLCPLRTVAPLYDTGVHAVIPPQHSIPARLLDPKTKVRGRVHFMVAGMQARKVDPKAWPLLTDEDGFITECTLANVFFVKDNALLTPEPRNILLGITRKAAIELAAQLGWQCRECNIEPYHALTADEAFFTTTPFSIVPMTRLDGYAIGDGKPGPLTKQFMDAWSGMVGIDTIAQAKQYAGQARG